MLSYLLKTIIAATALASIMGTAYAQTEVTMWTFLDLNKTNPRSNALNKIIDNFESANPGIKVKVETQPYATMSQRFFLGHQQGRNPDLIWIDSKNVGGLLQSGAGLDLNEAFVNGWSDAERNDFYIKAGWNAGLVDGKRYLVPLFHGGSIIYYRKDLFREAGIDPASLKTWDALIAAGKALKKDTNDDGITDVWGLIQPLSEEKTEPVPALTYMIERIDPLFNEDCTANFANNEGVTALKMNASMITESGISSKESFAHDTNDAIELFAQGRGAMAVASALRYGKTAGQTQFDAKEMGLLKWPSETGAKPGPMLVQGWYIGVWKDSSHTAEAAKFAEHAINADSVKLWSTRGGQVPTRSSVFADAEFSEPSREYLKVLRDSWAENSYLYPPHCNNSLVQSAINGAIQAYILGGTDPMTALKNAERKHNDVQ
jgi:multiple sugar transport system substrate-binding protein